ncbi:MAG: SUMF1/EgtB/PvdO family nonheme iron enzyme [Limisphaerales bacterium]
MTANPTFFTDTGANGQKRFYRTITVGLPDTNLVWLPPATFVMGSPATEADRSTNEGPQTTVTLTQGFLLAVTRCAARITSRPWAACRWGVTHLPQTLCCGAVRGVTWSDATNYCALRTAADSQQGKIPAGFAYRLPTEAEWEYACRANTTTVFAFGNELRADTVLGVQAIFKGVLPYPTGVYSPSPLPAFQFPEPVGTCAPNAFGLYDLHGNVGEWCLDGYNSNKPGSYPGGSVTNFSSASGIYQIVRAEIILAPGKIVVLHPVRCCSLSRQIRVSASGSCWVRPITDQSRLKTSNSPSTAGLG